MIAYFSFILTVDSSVHYSLKMYSKNGKNTVEVLDKNYTLRNHKAEPLSKMDIRRINRMYDCEMEKNETISTTTEKKTTTFNFNEATEAQSTDPEITDTTGAITEISSSSPLLNSSADLTLFDTSTVKPQRTTNWTSSSNSFITVNTVSTEILNEKLEKN